MESPNGNLGAIRRAVHHLNAGNFDQYFAAFTDDCQRTLPGSEIPVSLAEVRAGLEAVAQALDGFELKEVLLFGSGRHVCAH